MASNCDAALPVPAAGESFGGGVDSAAPAAPVPVVAASVPGVPVARECDCARLCEREGLAAECTVS